MKGVNVSIWKKMLIVLLSVPLLNACDHNAGNKSMNPTNVKIKIGEQGAQFLQRNKLPAKGHIKKQPAGLNFYKVDWSSKAQGTVSLEHGSYSFQIPFVLGVTGTENIDFMGAGLASFDVYAGITAADTVNHDEARKEFIKLLQHLLALGWKPLISYEDPRLTAEQAYSYAEQENRFFGIPANYAPTLEQWRRIDSGDWFLYADDVFLGINFRRGVESKDPSMQAYLFSFELHSKEQEAKAQFEGDDRDHWQDLWVDKIKSMKKERYAKEKELIQRGFTIYTEYQEPRIHPLDPVEP
jgi:hypothetical protein